MKTKPDLFGLAMAFLTQHQAEHLEGDRRFLIQRCVAHLMDTEEISEGSAEDVTLQAFCEMQSRHHREFINLARTTSFGVFVCDPVTGHKHVFSLDDLMTLMRVRVLESLPVPSTYRLFMGLPHYQVDVDQTTAGAA